MRAIVVYINSIYARTLIVAGTSLSLSLSLVTSMARTEFVHIRARLAEYGVASRVYNTHILVISFAAAAAIAILTNFPNRIEIN